MIEGILFVIVMLGAFGCGYQCGYKTAIRFAGQEVKKLADEVRSWYDPDAPAGEEHLQEVGPRKEFHSNAWKNN